MENLSTNKKNVSIGTENCQSKETKPHWATSIQLIMQPSLNVILLVSGDAQGGQIFHTCDCFLWQLNFSAFGCRPSDYRVSRSLIRLLTTTI